MDGIGKSPSRLDLDKLSATNAHYIRSVELERIKPLLLAEIDKTVTRNPEIDRRINAALPHMRDRGTTLPELAVAFGFLTSEIPLDLNKKARKALRGEALDRLALVRDEVATIDPWHADTLKLTLQAICDRHGLSMGQIGPPLRAALTGGLPAPDIDQVMEWLGKEECLARIGDQLNVAPQQVV